MPRTGSRSRELACVVSSVSPQGSGLESAISEAAGDLGGGGHFTRGVVTG